MRTSSISILVTVWCWITTWGGLGAAPAEVCFAIGSDTAIWNYGTTVNVFARHPYYAPDMFTAPDGVAYAVMDPAWRRQFLDSYGQPLKLTWWMMAGNIYRAAGNLNVPNPNLMTLHLMKQYHGEALRRNGDELSLHYHTFVWSDYLGAGHFYWNQSRAFNECREDFDVTVAQFLLDEEVFPVSFRSGWHYLDNEWQRRLNELLPFSLDNDWPVRIRWVAGQPIGNVQDWSMAPGDFTPFQPASTNYQTPGGLSGWNVRSVKMPNLDAETMNAVFARASNGVPQVVCLWNHLPESFLPTLSNTVARIEQAALAHPEVRFRYCTAVEAMQRWLGQTNLAAPELDVAESLDGRALRLNIHVSKPIFQPQPFVAFQDVFQQCHVVGGAATGENSWEFTLPVPASWVAKAGVAVTDRAGNLTTRVLRYLPDEVFLDNLDPRYAELAGNWTHYSLAAWGTDSRIAALAAGQTARAQWALPVSWKGGYDLSAQIPYVWHAAQNPVFTVYADNDAIWTTNFDSMASMEWLPIGTLTLDPARSNVLEMAVSGVSGKTVYAVADVVKLSPHPLPPEDFIGSAQVDAADTTANILWTTAAPATGGATYGRVYDEEVATNTALGTVHVLTLSGLSPGTNYYFNLCSFADGVLRTRPGCFRTTNYAYQTTTSPLLELARAWRHTTANLDGVNWFDPGYDDSAWAGPDPALLWADVSPEGPDPRVYPRNTPLPVETNGYPFRTYYFRAHFNFTNDLAGVVLTATNYLDDGAVFYLNGVEIQRYNLPAAPSVITNATPATENSGGARASNPVVFDWYGGEVASLVQGDNVFAVAVHNAGDQSPDVAFGSALYRRRPYTLVPRLNCARSELGLIFYWNGEGYQLQQTARLNPAEPNWENVPGAASPCLVTNEGTRFYRLLKAPATGETRH
jgi:hypothetical protein